MTSKTATGEPEYLTFEEAAAYLASRYRVALTGGTIRNKVSAGEIPSRKVAGHTRIILAELDAWAIGEWEPEPQEVA